MSVVAIVGRPNVGKSTIFNILTASKSAIVADFSGLTRDRKYGRLKDSQLTLIDTGGLNEDTDDMSQAIKEQTDLAIEEADYLLFVVDAIDGLLPTDKEIAKSLRKQNKEITLLINKADNSRLEESSAEFNSLGFKKSIFLSASHNKGFGELRDLLSDYDETYITEDSINQNNSIKISIIGRPNAGKSTLFNALLNKERSTVSNIPGTTRDKVVESLEANKRKYLITDTAGIPRKKQKDQIDRYSSEISIKSLENTDIALIVVDSEIGLSFEDKRILNSSIENFVTPLLILNKWDLLDTEQNLWSCLQSTKLLLQN